MFLPDVPVAREMGSWGAHEQQGFPRWAALEGPGPQPPDTLLGRWPLPHSSLCTCLCLWSGEAAVLSCLGGWKREEVPPIFTMHTPGSWKDAQLERRPCAAPNANSPALLASRDPGQARNQPGSLLRGDGCRRRKQDAVVILC